MLYVAIKKSTPMPIKNPTEGFSWSNPINMAALELRKKLSNRPRTSPLKVLNNVSRYRDCLYP